MTIKLCCTVCGKHLYNRKDLEHFYGEILSPQGLTMPDGRAPQHLDKVHWCGCASPAKGIPSLVVCEDV